MNYENFDLDLFIRYCIKYLKVNPRPLDFKKNANNVKVFDDDGKKYSLQEHFAELKSIIENNPTYLTEERIEKIKSAKLAGVDLTFLLNGYQDGLVK